jgi:tartrate dehydratase beta subunit/fumarate hydratase class I family protein
VAFSELGPEALYELVLTAFPAVVIVDGFGRNLHDTARGQWRTEPVKGRP